MAITLTVHLSNKQNSNNMKNRDIKIGVKQRQLNGAIGDEGTTLSKLPEGLTIPSCWTKYPELPEGVPRPKWWDTDEFRKKAICAEGEEPRRLPARD